ncbi:hypothetical protein J6590_008811 [Homalodisca vitripennis]|nr:hypothetical protein J6590_008811 [Homalodisca vitripennis]
MPPSAMGTVSDSGLKKQPRLDNWVASEKARRDRRSQEALEACQIDIRIRPRGIKICTQLKISLRRHGGRHSCVARDLQEVGSAFPRAGSNKLPVTELTFSSSCIKDIIPTRRPATCFSDPWRNHDMSAEKERNGRKIVIGGHEKANGIGTIERTKEEWSGRKKGVALRDGWRPATHAELGRRSQPGQEPIPTTPIASLRQARIRHEIKSRV